MEASREAEKEGLKKRTILQNKLLDKAGLKSKSVRGEKKKKESFHSFIGFSSYYDERKVWKLPSSHHHPSALLITFRLDPNNLWVKESHFEMIHFHLFLLRR